MNNNNARPRAVFALWMACHNRLSAKERLMRFGIIDNVRCYFCVNLETQNHLLFECLDIQKIWLQVLSWLKIQHKPSNWQEELQWVVNKFKGKGRHAQVLKCAFTESVYSCWKYMNTNCFDNNTNDSDISYSIINTIVQRDWAKSKLRRHMAKLMMP